MTSIGFTTAFVLAILKLMGAVDLSWAKVLCPLWIAALIDLAWITIATIIFAVAGGLRE